jgi:hypothetical protein
VRHVRDLERDIGAIEQVGAELDVAGDAVQLGGNDGGAGQASDLERGRELRAGLERVGALAGVRRWIGARVRAFNRLEASVCTVRARQKIPECTEDGRLTRYDHCDIVAEHIDILRVQGWWRWALSRRDWRDLRRNWVGGPCQLPIVPIRDGTLMESIPGRYGGV